MRKCWTCGTEHDSDEACPQHSSERSARAAGGSLLFSERQGGGMNRPGPVFAATYGGECAACDGAIFEGEMIRADGRGGYVHEECEE